jgi:hypothetical protein
MAFRITGIRKSGGADNPHEAISHYRWIDDGKTEAKITDRLTVVGWVEGEKIPAYVKDNAGDKAYCKVNVSRAGTKFLQTNADGIWTDNLLSLPEV